MRTKAFKDTMHAYKYFRSFAVKDSAASFCASLGATQVRSTMSQARKMAMTPYNKKLKDLHPIPIVGVFYEMAAAQEQTKATQTHATVCPQRYPR